MLFLSDVLFQFELADLIRPVAYAALAVGLGVELGTRVPLGDAREAMPAPYSGELLEIGFNPEFVRDGLDSIDDDEVVVKLISPLRPGLLEPSGSEDFSYLVMPIRLNV